jgi:hypothetical protein
MAVRNMPDPERTKARLPPRWLSGSPGSPIAACTGGSAADSVYGDQARLALQPNVAEIPGGVMHDRDLCWRSS